MSNKSSNILRDCVSHVFVWLQPDNPKFDDNFNLVFNYMVGKYIVYSLIVGIIYMFITPFVFSLYEEPSYPIFLFLLLGMLPALGNLGNAYNSMTDTEPYRIRFNRYKHLPNCPNFASPSRFWKIAEAESLFSWIIPAFIAILFGQFVLVVFIPLAIIGSIICKFCVLKPFGLHMGTQESRLNTNNLQNIERDLQEQHARFEEQRFKEQIWQQQQEQYQRSRSDAPSSRSQWRVPKPNYPTNDREE